MPGDPDLQTLIPAFPTYDAAVLEFDFVPVSDVITFKYVFASEEYNEYGNSDFNDVFGFFVNGVNVALLPDGVTLVSINTVNGGNPFGVNPQNPSFFIDNDCNDGPCSVNIEADGLTVVLTAVAQVNAGQVNHAKLAISDAGDHVLDSWVLIKVGSFQVDDVPPSCEIAPVDTNEDGETFIEITVSDNESGLFEILVTQNQNAEVTGHIAGTDFMVGTTDPVIVTATKILESEISVVELEVSDFAGNVTVCDPVITMEIRETGKPVTHAFTDIPEAESNITVKNGEPGLKNLEIIVNGDQYDVAGLQAMPLS
ncbi:MAG: choice-of-anchor L domain-containing protein [Pseudomonadota bacterium]